MLLHTTHNLTWKLMFCAFWKCKRTVQCHLFSTYWQLDINCIHLLIGVIYTGDAGDMSPPLFEMADFVPTTFWKHLVKMFWKIKRTKKC